MIQDQPQLFHPHHANPILSADQWPYPARSVFNPGAVILADGTTLLLCRVEDGRGHSHLCAARSANGIDGWEIDPEPTLRADPVNHPEEMWGVEDPRITWVPALMQYAVVYTACTPDGPGAALALTRDFITYERLGVIMTPEDTAAAPVSRRFGDNWALVHRPVSSARAPMWLSYSVDLRHWGNHRLMLEARRGARWDGARIGLFPPPVETPGGWLVIYHGVRMTGAGTIYRLGVALFDRDAPDECLKRGDEWSFGPTDPGELNGDVGNVVFPCGTTLDADGDTLRMYYGAADTSICLATASAKELLEWLDAHDAHKVTD